MKNLLIEELISISHLIITRVKVFQKQHFIGFKAPLGFYKNIKEGHMTQEKADEEEKRI